MIDSSARRTGTWAVIGGLLLFGSVAAELVHPVQAADGTSREPLLHSLYLLAWVAGWMCVLAAIAGVRGLVRDTGTDSRAAAVGAWLSIGGAAAFAVFGAGALAGVVAGIYLEVAFMLFLVAFALLIPGQLLLAIGGRRLPGAGPVALLIGLAAAGLIVAVSTDTDPFHDLGFFLFDAAWMVLGVGLRQASVEASARGTVSAAH